MAYPYGFAVFDVDPGAVPGGVTTMKVRYLRTAVGPTGIPDEFDTFTLRRMRSGAEKTSAAQAPAFSPLLAGVSG